MLRWASTRMRQIAKRNVRDKQVKLQLKVLHYQLSLPVIHKLVGMKCFTVVKGSHIVDIYLSCLKKTNKQTNKKHKVLITM